MNDGKYKFVGGFTCLYVLLSQMQAMATAFSCTVHIVGSGVLPYSY